MHQLDLQQVFRAVLPQQSEQALTSAQERDTELMWRSYRPSLRGDGASGRRRAPTRRQQGVGVRAPLGGVVRQLVVNKVSASGRLWATSCANKVSASSLARWRHY
jgi:hypothetical protein